MPKYIEKESLYNELAELEAEAWEKYLDAPAASIEGTRHLIAKQERGELKRLVAGMPSVAVPTVRTGVWTTVVVNGVGWWKECSLCGAHWRIDAHTHECSETEFCHHCGAKMRKEDSDE